MKLTTPHKVSIDKYNTSKEKWTREKNGLTTNGK